MSSKAESSGGVATIRPAGVGGIASEVNIET
jgi:hypothetical protein